MILKEEDLDYAGEQFGFRIVHNPSNYGKNNIQIELFSEDDENWYLKTSFSEHWLDDLIKTAKTAKNKARLANGRDLFRRIINW